jgi:transposase-like protein
MGLSVSGRGFRAGDTIDFLLSRNRDRVAAKGFLQRALSGLNRPRVINVDGDPAYPGIIY